MIVKLTTPTYADRRASLKNPFILRRMKADKHFRRKALTALCWALCGLILLSAAAHWPDYYSPGGAVSLSCCAFGFFWQACECLDGD